MYGWGMPQKLLVNGFKLIEDISEIDESFIESYNEESGDGYFLEVDVQYPENLHNLHNDLLFLLERMKTERIFKVIGDLHDKTGYVVHKRNLKQVLNHELVLKKVYRVIKFNQKSWLKPYIHMNTNLRKAAKNGSEKDYFKLMNNSVFGKTMQNARKHRDIKLVTERRRNYIVPEPNYHTRKIFTENLLAIEMKKTQTLMNKTVCLGLSILGQSKTVIYEFCNDYVKPK